jgi:hypothetical protein
MAGGTVGVIVVIVAAILVFAYVSLRIEAKLIHWVLRFVALVVVVGVALGIGYYAGAI